MDIFYIILRSTNIKLGNFIFISTCMRIYNIMVQYFTDDHKLWEITDIFVNLDITFVMLELFILAEVDDQCNRYLFFNYLLFFFSINMRQSFSTQ